MFLVDSAQSWMSVLKARRWESFTAIDVVRVGQPCIVRVGARADGVALTFSEASRVSSIDNAL